MKDPVYRMKQVVHVQTTTDASAAQHPLHYKRVLWLGKAVNHARMGLTLQAA